MRLFISVFTLLVIQLFLEALAMAILVKIGIGYLDVTAINDSFIETFFAMLVYVSLSKIIYLGLPYIILIMILHHYLNKHAEINYRLLAKLNPFVNLGLFIPVWLYFRESNYLWNPVISALIVSLAVYLFSLRLKKPQLSM